MTAVRAEAPRMRYSLDSGLGRLSPAERSERGRSARAQVPRESHAKFERSPDRPYPLSLLTAQAATRLPDLIPVRWGRMAASPFAYYRGAAHGQRPGKYAGDRLACAGVRRRASVQLRHIRLA